MKEKDLKELGFKKTKVSAEESGDTPFHYYTYDFKEGTGWGLSLISSDSDSTLGKKDWKVEIVESGLKPFEKKSDVKKYINLIKKLGG